MTDTKAQSSKKICRDCPIGCHRPGRKKKNKLEAYAGLWGLDITGFDDFVAAYHHLCDDLGLEAFETAKAVASALEAGAVERHPRAILKAVEETGLGTELGRLVGNGAVWAAKNFGVEISEEIGPVKNSGHFDDEEIFLDSAGLCAFAYSAIKKSPELWAAMEDLLKSKYGPSFDGENLRRLFPEPDK